MIRTTTSINNKLGLHARASAKLTKVAAGYPCDVWMSRGERRVNAKSIMGVMMLAAEFGSTILLRATGDDADAALDALAAVIANKFGES
jgi:phosphocarrier protein HPr